MATRSEGRRKPKGTDEVPAVPNVLTQIVQQLTADGWHCQVRDDSIRLVVEGDHATMEVRIDCQDDPGRYFIYVYCPIAVPPERRADVAEYLHATNVPLAFAKLGFLHQSGRVFSEAGSPVGTTGVVDAEIFDVLLHLALRDLDERVPDVMTIAFGGASAREVLARREHAEAPAAATA